MKLKWLRTKEKIVKIENFGIFEITSSKILRNWVIQVRNIILRNLLYETGHPSTYYLLIYFCMVQCKVESLYAVVANYRKVLSFQKSLRNGLIFVEIFTPGVN